MIKRINNKGSLLGLVLAVTLAISVIGLALITLVVSDFEITTKNVSDANALLVAEAGIEQSLQGLNNDDDFAGYPTAQEFFNNSTQGRATFETTIENDDDSEAKFITSTGYVYRQNSNEVVSKRKVKVTVVGTGSEGYSVLTGPGGLIMGGNSNITNSDVYVNGTISMTGNATIGTQNQPVYVNAAHKSCPSGAAPGPTYPTTCSNGQPIALENNNIIYGTVCATNQTTSTNILPGNGGEGLKPGCTSPDVSQPTYDRAAHVASMTSNTSANSNTYRCNGQSQISLPDKITLTGDYSLTGNCTLTLNGNIYITGNLSIGGTSQIRVADSLGSTRPVVVVDGTISVSSGANLVANASGTGIQFISFKSTASCNPSCTTVTGNDLKNSQNLLTIEVGDATTPGMIFQAYWSKVLLKGHGNIGAAVGQTVDLNGGGTVTFGTILSSGAKTWTITSYQQIYD